MSLITLDEKALSEFVEEIVNRRMKELPELLTPAQVAKMFKVSVKTIQRRADDGTLPCVWLGGERRFPLDKILALVESA